MKEYIYIREFKYYDIDNLCKLGRTICIPERNSQYITYEPKRGYFTTVFEVEKDKNVEKILQDKFDNLNLKDDGGTEFYDKQIINLIEPYLQEINIKYKRLSKQDIDNLERQYRQKLQIYKPRDYQDDIINKAIEYYNQYNKGLLVLPCGIGKTLISLWIIKQLKCNTILIGVPNKLLLNQWKEIINNLFKDIPYLIVSNGIDNDAILQFLEENSKNCIVITTYSSSHKVYEVCQDNIIFDVKLLDEVHHLTTNNMKLVENTKRFIQILNIPSIKQIGLTATLKLLESEDEAIVSNDNPLHFGKIIDEKSLLWAIDKDIVCDYNIQTVVIDEEQIEYDIVEENDKRLFLSAYTSLKSIYENHSHHLLIYCNNKENSLKIIEYIKILLDDNYFDLPELYYSNYDSDISTFTQHKILDTFEKSKSGIITCVYCLGEGWDFPILDGVVFAENMTSKIRIVQSALRASRKNKNKPSKISKIILPILNKDDWLDNNENNDLKKVREVIYQMSLEDTSITQKIKVFKININQSNSKVKESSKIIEGYSEELTRKLRLKTIKRIQLDITYEKAKKIIAYKDIKSKEDYYKLQSKDKRLPQDPETIFKGKFTNWVEYLSIERIYYSLSSCKEKIKKYLEEYPELKRYYLNLSRIVRKLCQIDKQFPPNDLWIEYYGLNNLEDIIIINNKKKRNILV